MGKNIIQQARGKGGPRYRAPSFNYIGKTFYPTYEKNSEKDYFVEEIFHCPGHTAPLIKITSETDAYDTALIIASEGLHIGMKITLGGQKLGLGNILFLKDIPEGTPIFNIESRIGDGGKFIKASGSFAKVVGKSEKEITVQFPSKMKRNFHPECRATIGVIAGGGRTEKPLLKAGVAFFKAKATNRLYPRVSANAMNAVDHPFGNKRSSRKAKNKPCSRNAPPGRKVGLIASRRTGKRK